VCGTGTQQSLFGNTNFGQWVDSGFKGKAKRAAIAEKNSPADPSIGLNNSAAAQNSLNSTVGLNPLQFDNYTAPVYCDTSVCGATTQPHTVESDIFTGTTTGACDVFHICTPTLGTVMPGGTAPAPASTSYTSIGVIAGVLVIGLTAFGIYKWHKKKK